jgi:hypothetical protein
MHSVVQGLAGGLERLQGFEVLQRSLVGGFASVYGRCSICSSKQGSESVEGVCQAPAWGDECLVLWCRHYLPYHQSARGLGLCVSCGRAPVGLRL